MYDDVVRQLKKGSAIPPMPSKHYRLTRVLRSEFPEFFGKKGPAIIFTGDPTYFQEHKSHVIEKLSSKGYADLFETRASTVNHPITKRQQKIADIEVLSDEELFKHIQDTFDSLTLLSEASASLKIRSMIVSGSPGTGKTYEVIKAMKAKALDDRNFYFHQVKGTISPIALYIELYRARNGVLILDDADEAFTNPESLQLLKAATESTKNRSISYRKLSMALEAEGIPQEFEFEGCVIILTNTNLEVARKQRQSHYDAIMSRAHYINAVLETDREKIMRIRHIVTTTTMLHQFLDAKHHQEVIDFVEEHHIRFRELSIRTIVKLAELRAAFPTKWDTLARGTLLD